MITTLKYVRVNREDLLDYWTGHIYISYSLEYCSVAFRSSLTQEQSNKLKKKHKKICLKVILDEEYENYNSTLTASNLETLSDQSLNRCLDFSLKCIKHPKSRRISPNNPTFNRRI